MPGFFAIKNEYQDMVHACKNQELLARLRKSLPPKGVASSMHGINVHIKRKIHCKKIKKIMQ